MAPSKKTTIEIVPLQKSYIEFEIVGKTSLITHEWSDKAKRMMLDVQTGKAKGKKHDVKIPMNDFINSLCWLTDKPENGASDDEAWERWEEAAKTAKFGFPVTGIKQSIITGAARGGLDVKMTELRGTFFLTGATEASTEEYAEIIAPAPIMREDMVVVGGMSKTADIRYRAEFPVWRMKLRMELLSAKYTLEQIINCIDYGGFVTGIGDWRPERDGQHGMYELDRSSIVQYTL